MIFHYPCFTYCGDDKCNCIANQSNMKWENWIKKARHHILLCGVLCNDDELLRPYFNEGKTPEIAAVEFASEINKGKPRS